MLWKQLLSPWQASKAHKNLFIWPYSQVLEIDMEPNYNVNMILRVKLRGVSIAYLYS